MAQVVQESILEEVSEQTRVLGDVLDLSVDKSESLPHCKAEPPQSLGFHLNPLQTHQTSSFSGFLGKTGLILWSIFSSLIKSSFIPVLFLGEGTAQILCPLCQNSLVGSEFCLRSSHH